MKTHTGILWIIAVFCIVLAVVYTAWSLLDSFHGYVEWVGTVGLLLAGILAAMIAGYLEIVIRQQGGVLPEDREDANIDDGDPELGHFSPWSWWPLVIAAGAAITMVGFAGNFWLVYFGIPFAFLGIIGWIYEYYRGNFAR